MVSQLSIISGKNNADLKIAKIPQDKVGFLMSN